MESVTFNLADIQYLLFIIPGFVVVWAYRFFARPKLIGEFEYAGLSFIWGIILLATALPITKHLVNYAELQKNLYALTLSFAMYGFVYGWLGSFIARCKWFKKAVDFFRPENFGK